MILYLPSGVVGTKTVVDTGAVKEEQNTHTCMSQNENLIGRIWW